jgi:DNA-binding LacI/PurR family transcriptional regulator
MNRKAATIRDVAEASGVSTATVSYVLNNGPRNVEPSTRMRVLDTIARLKYHPNGVARGLSRKRMDCLGIVFPEPHQRLVADSYFNAILDGVVEAATDAEQNVMLYTGFKWSGRESLPTLCDSRVDGLVIIAANTDSDIVPLLVDAGRSFVLVSDTTADGRVSSVDIDNIRAVEEIIDHLVRLGHRQIALLSGEDTSPSTRPRRNGFLKAMARHGLAVTPEYFIEGYYSREWGEVATADLLRLPEPPTAIFAGGDGIAMGVYSACAKAGVSIPGDISVIGFDDAPFAKDAIPSLTTIRHPLTQIGLQAARILIDQIEHRAEGFETQKLVLPAHLVVRESTAPPRQIRPD